MQPAVPLSGAAPRVPPPLSRAQGAAGSTPAAPPQGAASAAGASASGGGGGSTGRLLLLATGITGTAIFVGYAKVPAFKSLLTERGIDMPEPVHGLYRKLGWEGGATAAGADAPAAAAAAPPPKRAAAPAPPAPAPAPGSSSGSSAQVQVARRHTAKQADTAGGGGAAPAAARRAPPPITSPEPAPPAPLAAVKLPMSSGDVAEVLHKSADPSKAAAGGGEAGGGGGGGGAREEAAAAPAAAAADARSPAAQEEATAEQQQQPQRQQERLQAAQEGVFDAGAALRRELDASVLGDLDSLDASILANLDSLDATALRYRLVQLAAEVQDSLDATALRYRLVRLLDTTALRYRLVQLAAEMQDRTKWEALRLQQSLRAAEEEAGRHYLSLLSQQEVEAAEKLKTELLAQEARLLGQQARSYDDAVRAQMRAQETELAAKYSTVRRDGANDGAADGAPLAGICCGSAQLQTELSALRRGAAHDAEERQAALADMRVQVKHRSDACAAAPLARDQQEAIELAWRAVGDPERDSAAVHRVTAAALALAERLATSAPAAAELASLRALAAADGTASATAAAVPAAAAAAGVPTAAELRARFPRVRAECLRAALVPGGEDAGLARQAVGAALAAVTLKRRGMVEGAGADDALTRAEHLADAGDLRGAVRELKALQGLAAVTARDWVADAEARLATDAAVAALRARVALLNLQKASP
ncbi:mitochondrial inner membrane protein-domain-containing protein [Tribonema minus]|uniref:Mitochondrial inner membrane protein-domain-containing protein n=1 Tax=Tribonema minus TaxID=303371 RepID=A0A835Z5T1_9STRA|nr:mitochondrial inner membrane protein-domain-containing protein [Tribonema minus]